MGRKSRVSLGWAVIVSVCCLIGSSSGSFLDLTPDVNRVDDNSGVGFDASVAGSKSVHVDNDLGLGLGLSKAAGAGLGVGVDREGVGGADIIRFDTSPTSATPFRAQAAPFQTVAPLQAQASPIQTNPDGSPLFQQGRIVNQPPQPIRRPPPAPPGYRPGPHGKPCKRDAENAAADGGAQPDPNNPNSAQQNPPPASSSDSDDSDDDNDRRRAIAADQVDKVADDFRKFLQVNKINLTKQDEDLLTQFKNHQKEKLAQQKRSIPEPPHPGQGHPSAAADFNSTKNHTQGGPDVVFIEESRVFRSIPAPGAAPTDQQTNQAAVNATDAHQLHARSAPEQPAVTGGAAVVPNATDAHQQHARFAAGQAFVGPEVLFVPGQPGLPPPGPPGIPPPGQVFAPVGDRFVPGQPFPHANASGAPNFTDPHQQELRGSPEQQPAHNASADPHQLHARSAPEHQIVPPSPADALNVTTDPHQLHARAAPDHQNAAANATGAAPNATDQHHQLHTRSVPEHPAAAANATNATDQHQLHARSAPEHPAIAANATGAANATDQHQLHAKSAPAQPVPGDEPAAVSNATADPHQLHVRSAPAANQTGEAAAKNHTGSPGQAGKKKDDDDDDADDDDDKAKLAKRAISPRMGGVMEHVMNYFN